ncbi:MAG: hypothetical protein BJ554DRAFT_3411, partial [Olpidium bornovanus]
MSQCSEKYLENKCTPGDRVPAIEQACRAWESYPFASTFFDFSSSLAGFRFSFATLRLDPSPKYALTSSFTCMYRDPTVVGRAKVSAETFAEIINSFVEPISYKTM